MTHDSPHSEWDSIYLEATELLDGLEVMSFITSYTNLIGDEQQSWHITPNLTCPYSHGDTASSPRSSSTPYQWQELYAAWKLAIPSQNWLAISDLSLKAKLSIAQTAANQYRRASKKNLQLTASTTSTSAKRYSSDCLSGIRKVN